MQYEQIFKILTQNTTGVELDHINDFTLLVAVILSARATDKGVNKATKKLFEIVRTPEDMIKLGIDELESHVKTIGLYKTKSQRIMETSRILIEKHNSRVPSTLEELEQLPGVGRKTANVILNELFRAPVFPVDTHVFRVCNRLGITDSKTPKHTEKVLKEVVPAKYAVEAAHSIVLHGRYICKARKPLCERCPLTQFCKYYKEHNKAKDNN